MYEETILEVNAINKRFGGLEILKEVSFDVSRGERIGIIGPNGAGKTTFFNLLTGDLTPTQGTIAFHGKHITNEPNYKRTRRGIARTFQKNNLLEKLSIFENLLLVLQRKHGIKSTWFKVRNNRSYRALYEEAEALLETWGLHGRRNTKVENLSYGEQRQIEIMLGVATDPSVLLLDEPTAGMSQSETDYIVELLKNLPEALTLMIIEHDLDVIFGLSDRMLVLYNGHVLADDTPEAIRDNQQVNEIYMGKARVV
ncbi:branched-chain amino acid transport system ATP-binding protein [Thalassobacillus cyri]|uniref:Branched-chain amino acid transport system ATP-binding protein n=1 Tax=Thalassobacillus cyri TaxID=571932 RepID=A0A1H3ZCW5_9BACI|nr:ABC transporter ATP-binding protein [Thalassobacillus cyri]SEA21211.1 branched-chain amino acid transport system ATP-binding protein [Thalassobacillus cyri]